MVMAAGVKEWPRRLVSQQVDGKKPGSLHHPPESQLGLTTCDDDAWLRGFAPRKKRTPNAEPADARLDGMKRAKRSATRGKSHTSAVASESAEEPPAGMGEHSRPAALSVTPPARGRAGRRSRAARASPPLADSAGDLAATAADESVLAPPAPLPPLPSSGSLHGMTCAQLRELARAHGMPTSGTKAELIRALLLRARQVQAAALSSGNGGENTPTIPGAREQPAPHQ